MQHKPHGTTGKMNLHQILDSAAVVFSDAETDILITWDGKIDFCIFAGKFNGDYDKIDNFYREIKMLDAAREAARMWFQEHAAFNPGP